MSPETILTLCQSLAFVCWSLAGLAFAWEKWKASQSLGETDSHGEDDEGEDDEDDPSDWWKREHEDNGANPKL